MQSIAIKTDCQTAMKIHKAGPQSRSAKQPAAVPADAMPSDSVNKHLLWLLPIPVDEHV